MANYDQAFNLRKRHPSGKLHLFANELQSYLCRICFNASLDVSYGTSSGETLDIFPARNSNAPVFVFIHGGYFRALDKSQYSYLAQSFVRAGCSLVVVNYDLAPKVSVKDIIAQNIKAFSWVHHNIHRWQGNADHIVVGGHSVGAFLTAKILAYNWPQKIRASIKGAVLLSGLYDLTQMRQSFLNQVLNLSNHDVVSLSPMFESIGIVPEILLAVGDDETNEFIRQSKAYGSKLTNQGCCVDTMILKEKNHYTVSRLLNHNDNELMKKIMKLLT